MKTLEITDKNKKKIETLLKNKCPILILFYMNGCGHCTALEPIWNKIDSHLEKDKGIRLAKVEYKSMGLLPSELRKNIAGFPTIQILKQNKAISEYIGDRSENSILEFANQYKDKVENIDKKSLQKTVKKSTKPKVIK
jgi:hypothetical protein